MMRDLFFSFHFKCSNNHLTMSQLFICILHSCHRRCYFAVSLVDPRERLKVFFGRSDFVPPLALADQPLSARHNSNGFCSSVSSSTRPRTVSARCTGCMQSEGRASGDRGEQRRGEKWRRRRLSLALSGSLALRRPPNLPLTAAAAQPPECMLTDQLLR